MRNNFKSASLLTSRSMNHGMATARERAVQDPACQSHIIKYFQTGIIDFVDGFVCEVSAIVSSLISLRHKSTLNSARINNCVISE